MARVQIKDRCCPDKECCLFGQPGKGNIVLHGFVKLQRGRRRRYRCTTCGRTFNSTKGTPYYGLQCSQRLFELVGRRHGTNPYPGSKLPERELSGSRASWPGQHRLARVREAPTRPPSSVSLHIVWEDVQLYEGDAVLRPAVQPEVVRTGGSAER